MFLKCFSVICIDSITITITDTGQACVQLIRTQQIRPHRPRGSRERDQLVRSDGDRQGAGAIFQVDQRGSILSRRTGIQCLYFTFILIFYFT